MAITSSEENIPGQEREWEAGCAYLRVVPRRPRLLDSLGHYPVDVAILQLATTIRKPTEKRMALPFREDKSGGKVPDQQEAIHCRGRKM